MRMSLLKDAVQVLAATSRVNRVLILGVLSLVYVIFLYGFFPKKGNGGQDADLRHASSVVAVNDSRGKLDKGNGRLKNKSRKNQVESSPLKAHKLDKYVDSEHGTSNVYEHHYDNEFLKRCQAFDPSVSVSALPVNIVFVKTIKTGGSTLGGILRSIGCRRGYEDVTNGLALSEEGFERQSKNPISVNDRWRLEDGTCHMHSFFGNHSKRRALEKNNVLSNRPHTFVITAIRNHTTRCLSAAVFLALRPKLLSGLVALNYNSSMDETWKDIPESIGDWKREGEENFSKYIHGDDCKDFHYDYLKLGEETMSIDDIVSSYDLIVVTERMNESLIVLMHMWNLTMADMIYVSSKDSRHFALYDHFNISTKLEKQDAEIKAFMEGELFLQRNKKDIELYTAVNARLDSLIEKIQDFDTLLSRFTAALHAAEESCLPQTVFSDENDGGTAFDCVWRDGGCFQACIQDLVQQQKGAFAGTLDTPDQSSVNRLAHTRDHSKSVC